MMWDVFISHASEDKKDVAQPLADVLVLHGLKVWLDASELRVGDSLREKIDQGLAESRYGIVILSPAFFAKDWPKRELNALVAREVMGRKVILPIWHGVDQQFVASYSPILADKLATTTQSGLGEVAKQLVRAMPDVMAQLLFPPLPAIHRPTRIVIPKIHLDSPVGEVRWKPVEQNGKTVSVWNVQDWFVGWHWGSAFPGHVGNVVFSGHHNIKGEVFRYLVDLERGDEIDVYAGNDRYPYLVTEKHILREKGMPDEVRAANARWVAQTTDERITLVSSWPYTNNTHRVIVVAKPMWRDSKAPLPDEE